MKIFKLSAAIIVVVAATIFCMVQHQIQVRLREENESLRRQLDRMVQLETDNQRLSNLLAKADSPLASQQLAELLKLRGKVGMLRQQTNDLQKLREQNEQLRAALRTGNETPKSQSTTSTPQVVPLAVYPKESWVFAGFGTPEAAFQSLNWAMVNGDVNLLLSNCTPDFQKQLAERFENKSESEVAEQLKERINKHTQVSILTREVISDNEVVLSVLGDGDGSNPAKLVFKNIDGQWKAASEHR